MAFPMQDSAIPSYIQKTPLMQSMDWLLSNPSVPLSLRKQFFVLWENVVFGNYDDKDRKFLMSKFREWCILLIMYIPEQKWGNIQEFADDENIEPLKFDLNLLINQLEQLYYIQLTRGKEGFTVKEMTTIRNKTSTTLEDETHKKKGLRLF